MQDLSVVIGIIVFGIVAIIAIVRGSRIHIRSDDKGFEIGVHEEQAKDVEDKAPQKRDSDGGGVKKIE